MTEFRAPRVELLSAQHDRSSFTCGISALDDYFQNQAGQDARRAVTRVYVAVDEMTGAIVGFYTLSATSIAWLDIPGHLARKLPRYPIPAALIGRLAVDRSFARRLSNRIAELDRGSIYAFACGYDSFVERREDLLTAEVTRRALFDKKLAREALPETVSSSSFRASTRAGISGFVRTFGPPAQTLHLAGYTVLVWHKNLLADVR